MKSKYQNSKGMQSYYIDGFSEMPLQKTPMHSRVLTALKKLRDEPLKSGYAWEKMYEDTIDLKPNAYDYDPIFLDFLFDQKIPQILREKTGYSDLVLGDLAVRKLYPGSVYMGWHRDTYFYDGREAVGRMPPLQKLIFYPSLDEKPYMQLQYLPSSHLRMFKNAILDKLQTWFMKKANLFSSDEKIFLFNSAMFHSVPEGREAKGALRLFFIFCHRSQLDLFAGRETLHKAYLEKLSLFENKVTDMSGPPRDQHI